jgi:5-methylcytosine-specific restriction endonuclease McrA
VLVLNRGFQAILVTTVGDALAMIYCGKAQAVNHSDQDSYEAYTWADWKRVKPVAGDALVGTVGGSVVAPQVIRVPEYDRVPNRGVTCSRTNIFKRDRYTCQYCGGQPGTEELTLDHVLPRSQGGAFSWENIVLACVDCNQRKANRTPAQAGMKLRKQPSRPEWRPLFGEGSVRITSWKKFVDYAYWHLPLQQG